MDSLGKNKQNISDQNIHPFADELLPEKFGIRGRLFLISLIIICLAGLIVYGMQLKNGLGITAMRDYVSWGIYISNFVFFVAISLVGSLITAILYLLKIEWRAPLTRISELIAVASIFLASFIIIVDMGRPERLLNIIIHGRLQSPIVWDIIVVVTYMTISILLLYFPMLPDLALCRDSPKKLPGWQRKMYKILSLGWQGKSEEIKIKEKSTNILVVLVIPVALTIHTVTSWLFATTMRPGWDSTNFGPYFVAGAFVAGASAVIIGMFVFYKFYPNYQKYLTHIHFDKMGKLLMLLLLVYLYFNVNEYLVPGYKMKSIEGEHLIELFTGKYSVMFWTVMLLGMIIPIALLIFKRNRRPQAIVIISFAVLICAWFKRYLIVIPTLLHPFFPIQDVPESYKNYFPTWEEWTITASSLAGAILIITLIARYFPVISVWEVEHNRGINLQSISKKSSEKK